MSDLIDPKLQQQQSLLAKTLQDTFKEQRGAASAGAQATGLRRSSSYSNALGRQFGREQSVMSNMIADTLGKQIGLDEAQRGRDFSAEQNDLNRALQREQFNRQMNLKEGMYADQRGDQEMANELNKAKQIGSIALAPFTGGASLAGLF